MPRSYSSVYVHLVFSTKDRHPFLQDIAFREEVHRFLGGTSKTLDCQPVIVGGVADHVHILAGLGKSISQSDWVKELKRVSTVWMHQTKPEISEFSWQGGYGAFSIDPRNTEPVRRYIAGQDEHHRTRTFQEEFLALLAEYGIEVDERYVWN
jgi:REP element-mobilizing transposase RayT